MGVAREHLYEEVWADPMTKVAARYDVSSSFLARVCERLNVPRPARGYWAQLEVGKAPPRPTLPEPRPGDELEWVRGPHWMRALQTRRAPVAPPTPPDPSARRPDRPRRKRGGPHPLIAGARECFDGAVTTHIGYLRPTKRRLVDLFVSPGTLDRALAVADRLFATLERRGYPVSFPTSERHLSRPMLDERAKGGRDHGGYGRWSPDRPTVVYLGTVAIGLTVFELSEETEVQYLDGKWVPVKQVPVVRRAHTLLRDAWTSKHELPSGKLALRGTSPYAFAKWEHQWRETGKRTLTSMLHDIVSGLEAAAITVAKLVQEGQRRAEEEQRRWERERERQRREEEERRRRQNVADSRAELDAIIKSWGTAMHVEQFFADAERRAASVEGPERAELLDRLRRAREFLGGVDALQRFLSWKAPEER